MSMQRVVRGDRRTHNLSVLEELEPGDLVEFPRKIISHWGVYCGDGDIVHLTGIGEAQRSVPHPRHVFSIAGKFFNKAAVCKDNFWDVVEDSFARKNNSKDSKQRPLDRWQILTNATERLGEVGYSVFTSNCEHFAKWCRYGEAQSDQVENAGIGLGAAVLGVAAVAGIGALLNHALAKSPDEEEEKKRKK